MEAPAPTTGSTTDDPRVRAALVAVVVGGLLLAAIALVSARGADAGEGSTGVAAGPLAPGTEPATPRSRPSFTLTDTAGAPYEFASRTQGQLTFLFFGYTSCPDICPIHLATLAQALERTGIPAQVVFVTTDPERDTPERLRRWLDGFDPAFVGLTGTTEQIAAAQLAAGVPAAQRLAPDDAGFYNVAHASDVLAVTADDRLAASYPFGTREEQWADVLPHLVARGTTT